MENFYLAWALSSFTLALFAIWLLFKKQSTTNQIEDQTIKNKRNKGSKIDNNITSEIKETPRRKRRLNKLFNKNKKL